MSAARRSMAFIVAFTALWAVVERLVADLGGRYSLWQIVWTRYAVHLVLLALVFAWRSPMSLVRTRRPALQLGRSLLMLVMPGAWIVASHHGVDPALLVAMLGLAPLLVLAFGSVLLCERPGPGVWAAATLAGLGAIALAGPGRPPSAMWFVVAALPPVSLSLYVVATRALRFEPLRANLWYTALGVFLALSMVVPSRWVAPTPGDWVTLVAVGGVGLLTLLLLDRATEAAPVWVTAPLLNLQIVFSDALVSGAGPHHLGAGLALGALTICGVAVTVWWRVGRRAIPSTA